MARDDLHFRLRLPEDLKQRVETAATANRRSMTAEIVDRLQNSFELEAGGSQMMPAVALSAFEKATSELMHQLEVAKWMQKQQSMSMGLLEMVAATDGNLSPEFLETLRGMLARRGADTSFPPRVDEEKP